MITRILKFALAAVVALVIGLGTYLLIAPPDLFRVATNYSAKIVCSNVFIAGRNAEEVLAVDVQAPGHPLLKQVTVTVDHAAKSVSAKLFKFIAPAQSYYRDGLGCTNAQSATVSKASAPVIVKDTSTGLWPAGDEKAPSQNPEMSAILQDDVLLGEGMRAVVIVQNGRILHELYAEGFDAETPLLGWSMTKTVTAALIGTLVQSGEMTLTDTLDAHFPDWAGDARRQISIESMLAMSSGLEWNEGYGNVSDVTRMLYLEDDMAGFASGKPAEHEVDTEFVYSSGTSTMLSHVWQDVVGDTSLSYPGRALFAPLGMTSAVMEVDASDTFVGSSYMYATARDWARFGQFLLQKGQWNGAQLLPEGFTDWMFEPVAIADGEYTKGHMWRITEDGEEPFEDMVWMAGHDGQSVGISPARNLVIVRMGLTPSRLEYTPLPLARAVASALGD